MGWRGNFNGAMAAMKQALFSFFCICISYRVSVYGCVCMCVLMGGGSDDRNSLAEEASFGLFVSISYMIRATPFCSSNKKKTFACVQNTTVIGTGDFNHRHARAAEAQCWSICHRHGLGCCCVRSCTGVTEGIQISLASSHVLSLSLSLTLDLLPDGSVLSPWRSIRLRQFTFPHSHVRNHKGPLLSSPCFPPSTHYYFHPPSSFILP